MGTRFLGLGFAAVAVASMTLVVGARQAASPAATGQATAPAQPQITLAPGLREVPDYRKTVVEPPAPKIPQGFTPLFNGKDLSGWHVSKAARHGLTPDFHVSQGMILGTQRPLGSGGLLITDRKFKDFEKASTYHLAETQKKRDIPTMIRRIFGIKHELLDIQDYKILDVDLDRSGARARVKVLVNYHVLGDESSRDSTSAFKSLDKFDGRSQLTTWLHRITVNAALMRLRMLGMVSGRSGPWLDMVERV